MRNIFRSINTMFGRLSVLSVALLILMQLSWLTIVDRERAIIEAKHVSGIVRLAVESQKDPEAAARFTGTLGLRFVGAATRSPDGCPIPCADTHGPFENSLRERLPPASRVFFDRAVGVVWVRYGNSSTWLVLPADLPSMSRLVGANAFMLFLAIFVALIGAWQIERPLLRLARAAREFRGGHQALAVKAEGPTELRGLIGDFNEMAQELSDAEQERAVMLAGVAHDLRAPLARVQVRASLVADEAIRTGFLKDAASLAEIVTQFLDFARDAEPDGTRPWVSVDAYCQSRYAEADNGLRPRERAAENQASGGNQRLPLFILELQAGDGFMLPSIELDRILSNLIENGLTYGAPPLEITTSIQSGCYILSVRDHGPGMPEEDFARALRPFVRLDPARTGDAHCGLGLTIIRRLTRRYGGDFAISNAIDGGLIASLSFPSERHAGKAVAGLGQS